MEAIIEYALSKAYPYPPFKKVRPPKAIKVVRPVGRPPDNLEVKQGKEDYRYLRDYFGHCRTADGDAFNGRRGPQMEQLEAAFFNKDWAWLRAYRQSGVYANPRFWGKKFEPGELVHGTSGI